MTGGLPNGYQLCVPRRVPLSFPPVIAPPQYLTVLPQHQGTNRYIPPRPSLSCKFQGKPHPGQLLLRSRKSPLKCPRHCAYLPLTMSPSHSRNFSQPPSHHPTPTARRSQNPLVLEEISHTYWRFFVSIPKTNTAALTDQELTLEELRSRGLTADQVAQRRAAGLTNTQDTSTSRPTSLIIRTHLFTLFNLVLGICGAVVMLMGRWLDTLFLFAAVSNVVIGFVQEFSAKKKLDRIALLNRDPVGVLRDGQEVKLPLEEIVQDDVVILRRGEQVPADGIVLESQGLDLDESMLTGENDPIHKDAGARVLSASSVIGGSGLMRVTAVGDKAHAAKLAKEAKQFSVIHSELRAGMELIVKWITLALIPIIALVLNGQMVAFGGWSYALESGQWRDALLVAISSVTSMIPQGLALMTTISFALAAVKLAQDKVLIQEQPAVEVLARVDIVCFDKTGTLTEGGVHFEKLLGLDGGQATLSPAGQQALAWIGADSNANPTAAALADSFTDLPASNPSGQIAFSSAQRYSALELGEDGAWFLGAPEALLAPGSAELALAGDLAASGARTMVLAHAPSLDRDPEGKIISRIPLSASPQVFVIFREQVRADARQTLDYFSSQNIDLKVISGDNPRTVEAAARQAGMDTSAGAIDASLLPADGPELQEAALTYKVFGRVSPEQKKNMVLALQDKGHTVAMTGDGINDALALKHADLGIAMGNAAPATKAVSRLILLDGKFSRLPAVLAEGRKIIANTELVTNLFLTKTGFAILLGILLGALCWKFPFLPRQYSTADLLIVGGPAFLITLLPNKRRYVSGFLQRALHFAVPSAIIISLVLLTLNGLGRHFWDGAHSGAQTLQTATFLALVLMGIWNMSTVLRPLHSRKALLLLPLYAGLALALLLPLSLTYHQFTLPSGAFLYTTLGLALTGCLLIEANLALHRRWLARKHPLITT